MTEPRPTADIDEELAHAIKGVHRLRWAGTLALAVVVIVALAAGSLVLFRQQGQLKASCSLYRDLSVLPVKPIPPVKRPSKLGITIVVDSRIAYIGECSHDIPPPDPSLRFWAHFYRLTVPG
jgi:hypothetical protein